MDGMNYAPVFSGTAAKAVGPGEFRFSVIGLDHGHIFAMTNGLLEAGAEIAGVYDDDQKKAEDFVKRYPGCRIMAREDILSDSSIQLVASAIRPDRRASRPTTILLLLTVHVLRIKVAYADVNFTMSNGFNPSPARPPIVPRMPDIDLISVIFLFVFRKFSA